MSVHWSVIILGILVLLGGIIGWIVWSLRQPDDAGRFEETLRAAERARADLDAEEQARDLREGRPDATQTPAERRGARAKKNATRHLVRTRRDGRGRG